MRGFELAQAQQRRLAQLRRELEDTIGGRYCLDTADLLQRASGGDTSSLGNVTRRRLAVRMLVHDGIGVDQIAEAWSVPRSSVQHDLDAPLVDPERRAAALWDTVLAELKETPEPDRYVEPTGDRRVPGLTYSTRE